MNFSASPWPWLLRTRQFANLRTQAYHALLAGLRGNRIRIDPGDEPDSDLEQEIAAPLSDMDESGRYRLEPKDAIKRRLGRSPDKADAVVLAYLGLLWAEREKGRRRFM